MGKVAALMGHAVFWKRLHMVLFWAWVALLPPTLLWWSQSVGHISSWQAARAEKREEDSEEGGGDE